MMHECLLSAVPAPVSLISIRACLIASWLICYARRSGAARSYSKLMVDCRERFKEECRTTRKAIDGSLVCIASVLQLLHYVRLIRLNSIYLVNNVQASIHDIQWLGHDCCGRGSLRRLSIVHWRYARHEKRSVSLI